MFCCHMQVGLPILLLLLCSIHSSSAQTSSDAKILLAFAQKLSIPNSTWASPDPCSWKGVSCTSSNRVQSLNMSSAQLVGTISPVIAGLSRLTYLNLSNNFLTGNIPAGLILVSELKILDLSTNFLSGVIPPICRSDYSKLTELYLNDNQLSGKLDSSLAKCQQLFVLSLANNQLVDHDILTTLSNLPMLQTISLSGNIIGAPIPAVINTWQNLKTLLLEGCGLTGYLPNEIGSLKKLESLNLKNNRLIGSLPEALFDCIGLKVLYLNRNSFMGSIPSLIGALTGLQTFYGEDNGFTDEIPETMFTLIRLGDLNIRNNSLSGTISQNIGILERMYSLDLSHNDFVDRIPNEISGCQSLSWLDLSNNQLSSTIPSSIANLTWLNYLNLSHNQLTGQIPPSLSNLPSIQLFDVSYNQLVGIVPDTEVFRQFGMSSFEYNKGLCGWVTNQSVQACLAPSSQAVYFKQISLHIAIIVIIVFFVLVSIAAWQCIVRCSPLQTIGERHDALQVTFSVRDLFDATDGFDKKNLLGEGTHYEVYKGLLAGNRTVAVKRLRPEFEREAHQNFTVDWMLLSRAKNPSLVDVIGWCSSKELLAVVTAFMPNGTLAQQLHGKDAAINLPWERRMQIAEGVANGLAYLHREWQGHTSLRCELRTSCILLDAQFKPHLSNIRAAKSKVSFLESQISSPDGYTAPECLSGAMVTASAEVYSYGMIVLELLTRKKPIDFFLRSGLSIPEALLQSFPSWDVVDPLLKTADSPDQVLQLIQVALHCTNVDPEMRPCMETVLQMLKEVANVSFVLAVDSYASQEHNQDSCRERVTVEGCTSEECQGDVYQNPLFNNYNQQLYLYANDLQETFFKENNYDNLYYQDFDAAYEPLDPWSSNSTAYDCRLNERRFSVGEPSYYYEQPS